jgi:membrane protease YdiL (CAAX protease family)
MPPHVPAATRRSPRAARAYFGIAFAWTWTLWWTAAAAGRSVAEPLGAMLYMAGGLGPLIGAAWVVLRGNHADRRAFLRRVGDPRRIGARWWWTLAAVAAGPAVLGTTVAGLVDAAAIFPAYGVGAVGGAIAVALLAGFAEEPGWRGVAADAWQERTLPARAATGIGAIWALWHVPLAFIEGTYYHALGFGSLAFWLTLLALVQLGVLYLWLANGSGGSVLIAILAHAGFNVAASLAPRSTIGDVTAFVAITAATLVVVAATRGRLGYAASG